MTVVSEGPLSLRIHLNKYELKKHFISYDKITFSNPEVKKTIEHLFSLASAGIYFEADAKKLIEVFPSLSGGCIIKFTAEPNISPSPEEVKNIRLKKAPLKTAKYIFGFNGFEPLISVIEKLYQKQRTKEYLSEVYRIKNKYFLRINIPVFDRNTPLLINEYSGFSALGCLPLSVVKEYGQCISGPNAILTLGEIFKD